MTNQYGKVLQPTPFPREGGEPQLEGAYLKNLKGFCSSYGPYHLVPPESLTYFFPCQIVKKSRLHDVTNWLVAAVVRLFLSKQRGISVCFQDFYNKHK